MMMQPKFEVFDNFISPTYQDLIARMVEDPNQHWFYQPNMDYGINDNTSNQNILDIEHNDSIKYPQFVFDATDNTPLNYALYGLMSKIVDELLPNYRPVRIRVVLQTLISDTPKYYLPHTDGGPEGGMSLIYYPIDCTGDTYLFAETYNSPPENMRRQYHWNPIDSVMPRRGRLIMFPSLQYHAGSPQYNSDKRLLINFNFESK
tara:strand:- start:2913 stop:3524 length:612 start_codon:yes stop_codon:yes gene_type:complete